MAGFHPTPQDLDPDDTRPQRLSMVERQLLPRGIHDPRVLHAMGILPRERFLPPQLRHLAYQDGPLPIGQGQTISQPYMVAVMAQLLHLEGGEQVLEVGAGSGYGAALLALLARRVYAVERLPQLLDHAASVWSALGLTHITPCLGDGSTGWPDAAPCDAICVTAAAPEIPPSLVQQLVPETGRLVIPVGGRLLQRLLVVRRSRFDRPLVEEHFPCVFVPLLGAEGWPEVSP